MWLDNGRKDGLLEKWYVVRKDNEARAQQGAEMRLGQKKDGKVGGEGASREASEKARETSRTRND